MPKRCVVVAGGALDCIYLGLRLLGVDVGCLVHVILFGSIDKNGGRRML